MIARYTRPEMAAVWKEKHKFLIWLKVEMAVCEELVKTGAIPSKDWRSLRPALKKLILSGGVEARKVEEIEQIVKHDVIAFTTAVAEKVGPVSRYVHFGLTSSDVVDTSLSILIQEAGQILVKDLKKLLVILKDLARRYRDLPTIGRSHGMFAEPTSFGLKFLGWQQEILRNQDRLQRAIEGLRVGKLSGAVGVNAHWDPKFEEKILLRLGLRREEVSTQVIPRDRHAEFLNALAMTGTSLERIAVELRHLQRSEVGEVIEGFSKGQKGSSAMPHKRNPISSENITGCARLLRAYAQTGFENVVLGHERDISHSSAERVTIPDATILLDYAINRMIGILTGLGINERRIKENLILAGPLVFSGHYLLALVKAGATREEAYAWVQECALASLEGHGKFAELLTTHPKISKLLNEKTIKKLSSIEYQLRNVKGIYREASRRK